MISPNEAFVLVKILIPNKEVIDSIDSAAVFDKATSVNYYLDDSHSIEDIIGHSECECGHDHEMDEDKLMEEIDTFRSLCTWQNADPTAINNLEIGQAFKGITADSRMYTYQVVAKDPEGNSVWYPMSGKMDPVYVAWKLSTESKSWDMVVIEPMDCLIDKLMPMIEANNIYKITDIANNPEPIFDTDDMDEDYDDEDPRNGIYYSHEDSDGSLVLTPVKKLMSFIHVANDFVDTYKRFIETLRDSIPKDANEEEKEYQEAVDVDNAVDVDTTAEECAQTEPDVALRKNNINEFDPSKEDF